MIPLAFQFQHFTAPLDLPEYFPVAKHFVLDNRIIDDIVDAVSAESQQALQRALQHDVLSVRIPAQKMAGTTKSE